MNKTIVAVLCATGIGWAQGYSIVSPDGRNEIRLVAGSNLTYSVWRDGVERVSPTPLAMAFEGRTIGPAAKVASCARQDIRNKVAMPFWKKATLDESRNELVIAFEGDWRVRLAARNDAVGYRFETDWPGQVRVMDESADVTFPAGGLECVYNRTHPRPPFGDPFQVSWESPAERTNVLSVVAAAGKRHVYEPFLVTFPDQTALVVCESDVLDYPKRDFAKCAGTTTFASAFARVPDPAKIEDTRRHRRVHGRLEWIAATSGRRTYPWRLFLLEDAAAKLCANEAITALATPCQLKDISWIKPGKVAWEWWNDWNIAGVPFKAGTTCFRNVNTETYRHYIDFAAEYGLEYVIMDEGWSRDLDVMKVVPTIDMPGLVDYAKEKSVGIILWCSWPQLVSHPREIFAHYAAMGVKGFKIDFMDRDDQSVVRYEEETARLAAEYHLIVDYHGAFPPVGLSRTYPNVVNYEGVFGLEQAKWCASETDFPAHDLGTFFVRMTAGPMDYTPGAMINMTRYGKRPAPHGFRSDYQKPGSMGTRVHQMALLSLFEAPLQMLCDSPTRYRKNLECFRFMAQVPTVWDDTIGLAGNPDKFAVAARRKGNAWYVSGIASWAGADVPIDLAFLGSGEWQAEIFEDGVNCDHDAEDYVHRTLLLTPTAPFTIRMGPGGGFTMKLVPAEALPIRATFTPTAGDTLIVTNLVSTRETAYLSGGALTIDEKVLCPNRARFAFAAEPFVGAFFRYRVPAGCQPVVRLNGVAQDGVMPGRLNWIWRKWTTGDVVEMDFSHRATMLAPSHRADWMRGKYGIMVHWLFPSNGDIDRWTDAFNLEAFLKDVASSDAAWVVFTAGQCRGAYCSPNATFDRLCGPGHTSKRDLLAEIAAGVKKLGKKFIVYAACDFVKDGCADHAVQKGLGWDNSTDDRSTFQERWPLVLKEWSLRLGKDCDGWWLDGLGTQYPHGVKFETWASACRAGNPNAALAFNPGSNDFTAYGPSDFAAGETSSLKWAVPNLAKPAPVDAVRHYLFPIDGYWGGFWAWPDGEWAGVGYLKTSRPELFNAAELNRRLATGDFVKPIYDQAALRSFLSKLFAEVGAATINVGIRPDGRLNPYSLELIRSVK